MAALATTQAEDDPLPVPLADPAGPPPAAGQPRPAAAPPADPTGTPAAGPPCPAVGPTTSLSVAPAPASSSSPHAPQEGGAGSREGAAGPTFRCVQRHYMTAFPREGRPGVLVSGSGALPIPTMPGPTRDPRSPHEALRQNLQAAGDRARSVIWSTGRERESLILRRQEYALAQARYRPPEMEEPPIRRTEPIVEPIPQEGFTTEDLREIRDVLHQGEVHIGEQGRRALRRAIQRVLTSGDQ